MGANKDTPDNIKHRARFDVEDEYGEKITYDRHTSICVDISHQTVKVVDLGSRGVRVKLQVAHIKDLLDQMPRTAVEQYARDFLHMKKVKLQVAHIKDLLDQMPRTAVEQYARDFLHMKKVERGVEW